VFTIVNLLQSFDQSISRREGFGQFHDSEKSERTVWEIAFLNHECSMARYHGIRNQVCATCSTVTRLFQVLRFFSISENSEFLKISVRNKGLDKISNIR
jgi:hypothetical protein